MTDATAQEIGIDEQLSLLLSHPLRLEVFVILIEERAAPSDIRRQLGAKLNDISYHIKQLLKMGAIELVDEEPRRGQVAHIYRAVMRPIWSSDDWGKLSQEERERYAAWTVQLAIRDVVMAIVGGTFQGRRDAHTSRSLLYVDEQGWRKLNKLQDLVLKTGFEIEEESLERLRESKGEGISARSVMLCFEVPAAWNRLK